MNKNTKKKEETDQKKWKGIKEKRRAKKEKEEIGWKRQGKQ